MLSLIQILKSFLNNKYAKHRFAQDKRDELGAYPKAYFSSFGELNSDKYFYIIWCNNYKSGFFSILSHVMCHIHCALSVGMVPVVDLCNFKSAYNEFEPVHDTDNAWEYYFKPLSNVSLDEVYNSKNVFISDGEYPPQMSYNVTVIDGLYDSVYCRYISLQDHVVDRLHGCGGMIDDKTLGIHFRGQEMRVAPGHPMPPTVNQMFKYTDRILEEYDITSIFLVTEENSYLDLYRKRYGEMLKCTDSFRTYGTNAYNILCRKNHRYELGLEILIDTCLLAKCAGLLCGGSNVSEIARFMNNGAYDFDFLIQNGANSVNPLVSRYLYFIKKVLPPHMNGLSDRCLDLSKK